MRKIWSIAKREFSTYLDSLVAYILLVVFVGITGIFTWISFTDVFFTNIASMEPFFGISYWVLFLFIPALTMRMLAEEKRTGTLEVLLTRAVTDWQVVFGKFLGAMILILVALAFSLPWYLSIAYLGPVDHGAIIAGYVGLILMSAMYISIGIFTSSFTDNQIVAFLTALVIGIFFHWIFELVSNIGKGVWKEFFYFLSTKTHIDSMTRGVFDARDLVFFLSITVFGLYMAEVQLAKRNIADA
ncbi:MAG: ABC transporter permease subunit [Bacteroidia bacterium]|nr:ABC transporter permease subunit [Bacteroidia bacterium]